jgi:hypothetical protein
MAAIAAPIVALVLYRLVRRGAAESFATRLVNAVFADLKAGVHEDIAPNDGHRIREYFEGSGLTPPANWCAAAVTTWIREAAEETDEPPPIQGSMQAKKIRDQIIENGEWFSAEQLRKNPSLVKPGMIVVWDRSKPDDPSTSWWGHVGVIVSFADTGAFKTIEGNSGTDGTRVAEVTRKLDDPKLLGAGAAWKLDAAVRSVTPSRRAYQSPLPPEEGRG